MLNPVSLYSFSEHHDTVCALEDFVFPASEWKKEIKMDLESLFEGFGRGVQLLICPWLKTDPPLFL